MVRSTAFLARTVDNDLECGLAIAWCSGRDRLEACIVKVVLLQIEVIILSEDRDPLSHQVVSEPKLTGRNSCIPSLITCFGF